MLPCQAMEDGMDKNQDTSRTLPKKGRRRGELAEAAAAAMASAKANATENSTTVQQLSNNRNVGGGVNTNLSGMNISPGRVAGGGIVAVNESLAAAPVNNNSNNNTSVSSAPVPPPPHALSLPHPFAPPPFPLPCDPATAALFALNPHAMAAQAAVAAHAAIASAAQYMVQQQHQQQNQQQHHQQQHHQQHQQQQHHQQQHHQQQQQQQFHAMHQQQPNILSAPPPSTNVTIPTAAANGTNTNLNNKGSTGNTVNDAASRGTNSTTPIIKTPKASFQNEQSGDCINRTSGEIPASGGNGSSVSNGPNNYMPPPSVPRGIHHTATMAQALAMGHSSLRTTIPPPQSANMRAAISSLPLPVLLQPPQAVPSVSGGSGGGYNGVSPAPNAAPVSSLNPMPNTNNMQKWTFDQLETHVRMIQENSQPVPQHLMALLAEARHRQEETRRREEKKRAKRVANRRSASTSRARKKALVEGMARANACLQRQALILSLIPDLVVAITVDGTITFCSAQVERVLHHKCEDLVGENIEDVLVPASREAMRRLIDELVATEAKGGVNKENGKKRESGRDSPRHMSEVAAVVSDPDQSQSEQSFPLSVVKVKSTRHNRERGTGEHDRAGRKAQSSSGVMSPSRSGSSLSTPSVMNNPSSSDDSAPMQQQCTEDLQQQQETGFSSGVDYLSSACEIASEALNRNVKSHNANLCKNRSDRDSAHKDDVTGAGVTANNAEARLSSLQHRPKKEEVQIDNREGKTAPSLMETNISTSLAYDHSNDARGMNANHENSSDNSGYREGDDSFPSSEDTVSAEYIASYCKRGRRTRPLAPTCNVCLIRDDLTTMWCEVTSSIRTMSLCDDMDEEAMSLSNELSPPNKKTKKNKDLDAAVTATPPKKAEEKTELLLCLRPIRDSQEKVSEELRFKPSMMKKATAKQQSPDMEEAHQEKEMHQKQQDASVTASDSSESRSSGEHHHGQSKNGPTSTLSESKRPPKKRFIVPDAGNRKEGGETAVEF